MGYSSKYSTKPKHRSGKPREHRNDHIDEKDQVGTPVFPPSLSAYGKAQPVYLRDGTVAGLPPYDRVRLASISSTGAIASKYPSPTRLYQATPPEYRSVCSPDTKKILASIPPAIEHPFFKGHGGSDSCRASSALSL
jgi:hypothetical protein